jgi:hypothetical protein
MDRREGFFKTASRDDDPRKKHQKLTGNQKVAPAYAAVAC